MSKRLPVTEPPADRSCGECQACCEALTIHPTNETGPDAPVLSRAFQRCQWQREGACAIYEQRPSPCAGYHCMYRLGFGDPALDRPDRLGVVLEGAENGWLFVIESRPGAYQEPRVQALMAALRDPATAKNPATGIHVTPWGADISRGYWDGGAPPGANDPRVLYALLVGRDA